MTDLILGTANLETPYGFCRDSTLATSEFELILERFSKEIARIDSATAYSESHHYLTANKTYKKKFPITTKISARRFFESGPVELDAIAGFGGLQKFELLIHDGPELFSRPPFDIEIFVNTVHAKFPQAVFGLSVQTRNDMRAAIDLEWIEAIQIPINICDHRWLNLVNKFKDRKPNGVIRGRSLFLQGILLRKTHKSMPYNIGLNWDKFITIKSCWREKLIRILKRDVSDVELAILPVMSLEWLDGIVVGVNSVCQCEEIIATLATFHKLEVKSIEEIRCGWSDLPFKLSDEVLNPATWRKDVV